MKILSIVSIGNQLVGLGDDNKTYVWAPPTGTWLPNWDQKGINDAVEKAKLLADQKELQQQNRNLLRERKDDKLV